MNIPLADIINLLHECSFGTLATHSIEMPGYPFATALPFAPDEQHRPIFLLSRLAEHTKNIAADRRVSFLVFNTESGDMLTSARLTLIGEVNPVESNGDLRARYCRYHPDAEQYLNLGDFDFFCLEPAKLRMISGFGRMGWMDVETLLSAALFSVAEEAQLLAEFAKEQAPKARVLGVDRYGLDVEIDQHRERHSFPGAPLEAEQIARAMQTTLGGA